MAYQTIQPPFTLKFDQMSKKELKDYFQWFQSVMPDRIMELTNVVKGSPGFEKWVPDLTPESLGPLGNWLATHVETRSRTPEEFEHIRSQTPYRFEISTSELTNKTFSLAMDVGAYLAQVFLRNHASLKWEQSVRGSKTYIDYGQPIIEGFGVTPLNPIRIAVTLAYGLANKTKTGARLRELYDIWSKDITQQIPAG
jgi:hypothetical protein